ncbi:Regulator of chromosome condensation (RCC1) repeat protein [anaerobic digester metagenome]
MEPECLPASIYGYSYYVIQKNGDLVHWGDYAPPTYQAAEILMKNVASIVPGGMRSTLAIDQDRNLRSIYTSPTTDSLDSDLLLEDIAIARCGLNHYLALQEDGTLYVGGKNETGQMGIGETDTLDHNPTKLMSGVISITANDNCSYALLDDGTLLFWGQYANHSVCPFPVAIGSGFTKLFSGEYVLTANHTLCKIKYEEKSNKFTFTPVMENAMYASDNLAIQNDGSLWGLDNNIPLVPTTDFQSSESDGTQGPALLMKNVSFVTTGPFYSIAIMKDESMWLLPNRDLIAADNEYTKGPQKLMDHAPLPQIPIEPMNRQDDRAADFPAGFPNQAGTSSEITESGETDQLNFSGKTAALFAAAAIACIMLVRIRKKVS